ncbi:MAG: hypothetical protein HOE90_15460 [Bacteriovoracaceae bacterium]|jgi:hypothetical protein|nr:hypothetical protein [Bacteriovoracaceae bacterium]
MKKIILFFLIFLNTNFVLAQSNGENITVTESSVEESEDSGRTYNFNFYEPKDEALEKKEIVAEPQTPQIKTYYPKSRFKPYTLTLGHYRNSFHNGVKNPFLTKPKGLKAWVFGVRVNTESGIFIEPQFLYGDLDIKGSEEKYKDGGIPGLKALVGYHLRLGHSVDLDFGGAFFSYRGTVEDKTPFGMNGYFITAKGYEVFVGPSLKMGSLHLGAQIGYGNSKANFSETVHKDEGHGGRSYVVVEDYQYGGSFSVTSLQFNLGYSF